MLCNYNFDLTLWRNLHLYIYDKNSFGFTRRKLNYIKFGEYWAHERNVNSKLRTIVLKRFFSYFMKRCDVGGLMKWVIKIRANNCLIGFHKSSIKLCIYNFYFCMTLWRSLYSQVRTKRKVYIWPGEHEF